MAGYILLFIDDEVKAPSCSNRQIQEQMRSSTPRICTVYVYANALCAAKSIRIAYNSENLIKVQVLDHEILGKSVIVDHDSMRNAINMFNNHLPRHTLVESSILHEPRIDHR